MKALSDQEAEDLMAVLQNHREVPGGNCAQGCERFPCGTYAMAYADLRIAGRLPATWTPPPLHSGPNDKVRPT